MKNAINKGDQVPRKRNWGWGKQLCYAGKKALELEAARQGGRYSWLSTNKARWKSFCCFLSRLGIKDARQITHMEIKKYSAELKDKNISTIQNYLSCVNTVLTLMSYGTWKKISPFDIAGKRRSAIRVNPIAFTERDVYVSSRVLLKMGYRRHSFVPLICFYMGLRRREVCLLELSISLECAKQNGVVDIRRGTKGGRSRTVPRLVPASEKIIGVLQDAVDVVEEDKCLVPEEVSLKQFYSEISNHVLPVLKRNNISKLHELRAAYACRRYMELTGCDAPCNQSLSSINVSHQRDQEARLIISKELGHNRIQVLNSYIGQYPRGTSL